MAWLALKFSGGGQTLFSEIERQEAGGRAGGARRENERPTKQAPLDPSENTNEAVSEGEIDSVDDIPAYCPIFFEDLIKDCRRTPKLWTNRRTPHDNGRAVGEGAHRVSIWRNKGRAQ